MSMCVSMHFIFSANQDSTKIFLRHLIQNSLEPRRSFLWASTEYESDALYSWLLLETGGALSVELSPVFMSFPAQTGRIKILWRA